MQNFMKIRPVTAVLFRADGRAGRDIKLVAAFLNFANAPKTICKAPSTSVPLLVTVHQF
jgi:hypothetical protein